MSSFTYLLNSSTLISGERDAILVDTFLTTDQSRTLVEWVAASGKNLVSIYVTFAVPQRVLVDLRESMAKSGGSKVAATIPGRQDSEEGKVAMVENTVDATTGMITVRGVMYNKN